MIESLIKRLEKCKSTKSAKTILNKQGIETEEGFNNSYDFCIEGIHYRVLKNKYDDTCRVIKYTKHTISVESQLRALYQAPMCYGCTMKH